MTENLCAICDRPEHPAGQHRFITWREMEAIVASQPSEPPGLVEARYVDQWRPR